MISENYKGTLELKKGVKERELENKMIEKIRDVIMEFGAGFAFLGNQFKLKLGDKEYFIDLLFYHRKLQCLVAVELKVGEFKPEYAGKLNLPPPMDGWRLVSDN